MLKIERQRGSKGWLTVLVIRMPVWFTRYTRRAEKPAPKPVAKLVVEEGGGTQ